MSADELLALSVRSFCELSAIGRTAFYEEGTAAGLSIRQVGNKTPGCAKTRATGGWVCRPARWKAAIRSLDERPRDCQPTPMFVPPPDLPPIIGRASVIDGDTIEIHGQRIRLWGVDAPEGRQTCIRAGKRYRCGQEAANALADQIGRSVVTCAPQGRPDRFRRIVARCSIVVPVNRGQSRQDVAAAMVAAGLRGLVELES